MAGKSVVTYYAVYYQVGANVFVAGTDFMDSKFDTLAQARRALVSHWDKINYADRMWVEKVTSQMLMGTQLSREVNRI